MKRICGIALAVVTLFVSTLGVPPPGITLIGKGLISGTALDRSGLTGNICQAGVPTNCVPKALFGGFGSALAYTGHNGVFVAAPDRGPFDGLTDVPYLDRVQFLHIKTDLDVPFPNIRTTLLDTRILKNERGQALVGAAGAFVPNNARATLRFDPEGIRVGLFGTLLISDEYGPDLFEFGPFGHLLRRVNVPDKFHISNPNADPNLELLGNTSGRQANRGMEGLAISPNDRFLFGIMQSALLQDNGLNPGTTDRLGLNNRILKVDLLTGQKREYVYVLEAINRGQGVSEILAINDHEFLVLERDNRSNLQTPPQAPTRKKIYKIDLAGATDVSGVDVLPAGALPAGIVPVQKTLFIDLLDPTFNLAPTIAEKIEGLAWGPDLLDGRHVLYVMSDNDLNPSLDTQIYAFAIDRSLIDLHKQFLPLPLWPPWLLPRP
ncbi:MAG: esterase-like activity of phytase family protein [Pyrinomonadaceae bacterium]|nr:esterase-like activity of phytase family protein [Pyrinomonadaceae bacterium]